MTSILNKLSKKIKQHKSQSLAYIKFNLFLYEIYNQLKSKVYNLIFNYQNINEYKFPIMKKFILSNKMSRYSKIYKIKKNLKLPGLETDFGYLKVDSYAKYMKSLFIIGSGKCGESFLNKLFKSNKNLECYDESRPLLQSYYKFIKYNNLKVDDNPFF